MSDFGWLVLGIVIGMSICTLCLTYVERRYRWVSRGSDSEREDG